MLSDTDTGTYLHIPAHTYILPAHTCTYLYIPASAHTLAGPGVTPGPGRWHQQSLTQTRSQSGNLGTEAAAKSAGLDVA
jgi:hypothetical protein